MNKPIAESDLARPRSPPARCRLAQDLRAAGRGARLRVPLREIMLEAPASRLPVYDTSGPYTDPTVTIDVSAACRAPASPG